MSTLPCLVICQPWAWAIFHANTRKRLENRTWRTSYTGPLLILAGSRRRTDYRGEIQWLIRNGQPCPPPECLTWGAIVGIVEQVGCQPRDQALADNPDQRLYAEGPWCHVYRKGIAFESPIPYRGQQRIFRVPVRVVAEELQKCARWGL